MTPCKGCHLFNVLEQNTIHTRVAQEHPIDSGWSTTGNMITRLHDIWLRCNRFHTGENGEKVHLDAEVALPEGAIRRSSRHSSEQEWVDFNHLLHRSRCFAMEGQTKEAGQVDSVIRGSSPTENRPRYVCQNFSRGSPRNWKLVEFQTTFLLQSIVHDSLHTVAHMPRTQQIVVLSCS